MLAGKGVKKALIELLNQVKEWLDLGKIFNVPHPLTNFEIKKLSK